MDNGQTSSAARLTAWIGIVSSIVTVGLTIFNAYTRGQIDAADLSLKKQAQVIDEKLRERAAGLEESKERTTRYTFVHGLLPDLADKDATKKELTINLIRLTLTDSESAKLFAGFSQSSNAQLQSAGNTAVAIINKERNNLQIASEKEREGFESLLKGSYDQSILAFEAAEKAYPTYHQVYELAMLIKSRKQDLGDSSKRKEVLQQIVTRYSYGAPADLLDQIRKAANQ